MLRAAHPARRSRGGFTLLEILLASLLAALVLAAVYMLLSVTLQQTQTSRDAIEVEDVSRGVFNKMSNDLSGTLAPLPPKSGGNSAASGGQQAASSPSTPADPSAPAAPTDGSGNPTSPNTSNSSPSSSPTTPAAPTTPTDPSVDPNADPNAPGATDNATAVAADYAFQGGVIGEEKKLVIYAGKVPEALGRYGNPGEQVLADQRQIIYWLGSNGGLYRRERPWITADGVRNAVDASEESLDSRLIAEEVTDVLFEYFDGTSYVASWDGTAPGPDGVTPLGPPRAIKVTLTMQIPVSRGDPVSRQVSQVIVVRSAPGTYTPPLVEAPTDGGDNAVTDPATGGTPSGNMGTGGTSGGNTPSGGTPGGNSGKGSTPPSPGSGTGTPKSGGTPSGMGTGSPKGGTGGTPGGKSGGTGGGKR